MTKKYYAVKQGKKTGIFYTWAECREQVHGYSGAIYKSFETMAEAEAYMKETEGGGGAKHVAGSPDLQDGMIAYVDGSYQSTTKEFAYGAVIFYQDQEFHFAQKYDDAELAEMRNVAGELKGAEKAMAFCLEKGAEKLTIYHDYEGTARWCTGEWQAKKPGTMAYKAFYEQTKQKVDIRFVKVKGHSGDPYNELADQLAGSVLKKVP